MSRCSFLLFLMLAGAAALEAEKLPAAHPVAALDNHTASKLLIHVAKPHYPAIAKINLIQGSVKLDIRVNPKGKVTEVHVIEGEPLLAAAAIRAVRKWVYRPYHASDGAEPFSTFVVVKFLLHPRKFGRRFPKDPDGFLQRQIHPPKVAARPSSGSDSATVRFKVLVDSKGKVLDARSLQGKGADVEQAREDLQQWKFRPARWGTLAVPWYVIVKVPFEHTLADQSVYPARR